MPQHTMMRTLGRIAALGTAARAPEVRARAILRELHAVVPFDAAMLCRVDLATHRPTPIVAEGYPPRVASHLCCSIDLPGAAAQDGDLRPVVIAAAGEGGPPAPSVLCPLTSPDGRAVGFLVLAPADGCRPADAALAFIDHVAPVLASIVDPVETAARLAAILSEHEPAVAVLPGGIAVPLQGETDELLLDPESPLRRAAAEQLNEHRRSTAFLWPRPAGGWLACRIVRCRDDVTLLAVGDRDELHCLTRRELEVLSHLAAGESNAEIARQLWVTTRTVRAHVESILEKLEVSSRSGAVARAMDEGLLLAA